MIHSLIQRNACCCAMGTTIDLLPITHSSFSECDHYNARIGAGGDPFQ